MRLPATGFSLLLPRLAALLLAAAAPRGVSAKALCPAGYYQRESVVWICDVTQETVNLWLDPNWTSPVVRIPQGIRDLEFTGRASIHIPEMLIDEKDRTVVEGDTGGIISLFHNSGEYKGMKITCQGGELSQPLDKVCRIEGQTTTPLALRFDSPYGSARDAIATLSLSYGGLSPCPEGPPPGCAPYSPTVASDAEKQVAAWSRWAQERFNGTGGAEQAWSTLADEYAFEAPGAAPNAFNFREVPFFAWRAVWRTWQPQNRHAAEAFRAFDSDNDLRVSREEFVYAYGAAQRWEDQRMASSEVPEGGTQPSPPGKGGGRDGGGGEEGGGVASGAGGAGGAGGRGGLESEDAVPAEPSPAEPSPGGGGFVSEPEPANAGPRAGGDGAPGEGHGGGKAPGDSLGGSSGGLESFGSGEALSEGESRAEETLHSLQKSVQPGSLGLAGWMPWAVLGGGFLLWCAGSLLLCCCCRRKAGGGGGGDGGDALYRELNVRKLDEEQGSDVLALKGGESPAFTGPHGPHSETFDRLLSDPSVRRAVEEHRSSWIFHHRRLLGYGEPLEDGFRALFSQELLLVDARKDSDGRPRDAALRGFVQFLRTCLPPGGYGSEARVAAVARSVSSGFGGSLHQVYNLEALWRRRFEELRLEFPEDLPLGLLLGRLGAPTGPPEVGGAHPHGRGTGVQRHRAILFKYVCDSLKVCDTALLWDARHDGAEVVAMMAGGRPVTVDLMEEPGTMREARELHSLVQQLEESIH